MGIAHASYDACLDMTAHGWVWMSAWMGVACVDTTAHGWVWHA